MTYTCPKCKASIIGSCDSDGEFETDHECHGEDEIQCRYCTSWFYIDETISGYCEKCYDLTQEYDSNKEIQGGI